MGGSEESSGWTERFEEQGFHLLRSVLSAEQVQLLSDETFALMKRPEALERGQGGYALRHLLTRSSLIRETSISEPLLSIARTVLGEGVRPVKGILFDKGESANWAVRWHQDTTISVKERIEREGFGPWTRKDGVDHVQPPDRILEGIVAFRIHVDHCSESNGPLKVIPGSHLRGKIPREEILQLMQEEEATTCTAQAGDVLLMKPLLLHSSGKADSPDHRRVLHIEYTALDLPDGMEWYEG